MTSISPIPAKKMAAILRHLGFTLVRQRGSHAFYRHSDGRATVLPMHSVVDLSKGTIRGILKNVKLPVDEFERLRNQV